jgi:hypothetical protein
MKCGLCGLTGHNRRTCRQLNPVVCCSPEYSGITLCDDLFEMIGSQVNIVREKEIVDYWEDLNMQSKSLDSAGSWSATQRAWLAMDRGLRKFYGFSETCFNRKRIIEIITVESSLYHRLSFLRWEEALSWRAGRCRGTPTCGLGCSRAWSTHAAGREGYSAHSRPFLPRRLHEDGLETQGIVWHRLDT